MRAVALLAALALGGFLPASTADSQTDPGIPRVGALWPWSATEARPQVEALRQAFRSLGYVDGQSVALEHRYAASTEEFPALAAELVALTPAAIVAGGTLAALALKSETAEIPIVFVVTGDPVSTGLVASLARPGGNVTGVTALTTELGAKWLELIKEAVPRVTRVAVLWEPDNPTHRLILESLTASARALHVQVERAAVRSNGEVKAALAALAGKRPGALLVLPDPLITRQAREIASFANQMRLPSVSGSRPLAVAGGLIAYTANPESLYRGVAVYVDRILKGAAPADLPVQQPSEFDLVINLKAAKAIGLSLPESLLGRATEIIR